MRVYVCTLPGRCAHVHVWNSELRGAPREADKRAVRTCRYRKDIRERMTNIEGRLANIEARLEELLRLWAEWQ